MSLQDLVFEVAKHCGHENLVTEPVDLAVLGLARIHSSAEAYFAGCVPRHPIDGPFYQLLAASEIFTHTTDYTPSRYVIPIGFVTFATVPNGDAIAIDATDGRIHLVSHEIYSDDGIRVFDHDGPIPVTRKAVLESSENIFSTISSFFESWRDRLIDVHNTWDSFLEAAADDPNTTDESGNTLLVHFIRAGDLKMVKQEVRRGANIEHINGEGRTALGEAVTFGHPKIVKYLIRSHANVNAANDEGETPLMIAAQYSQLACMKLLIQGGADRSATDANGETALEHLCIVHGTPAMTRLLTAARGTD